jgi:hypothetical protein
MKSKEFQFNKFSDQAMYKNISALEVQGKLKDFYPKDLAYLLFKVFKIFKFLCMHLQKNSKCL